jgi:hypothetical protein
MSSKSPTKKANLTPLATATDADSVKLCVARFEHFHRAICSGALELKLMQYYAGLEVSTLYELHQSIHGETRGGAGDKSAPTLESFIEDNLNVTSRTARKYRGLFLSIVAEAPAISDQLNIVWARVAIDHRSAQDDGSHAITLPPSISLLNAAALQEVCKHADEWALHELFEVPLKDAGGTPDDQSQNEDNSKAAAKARVLKFWLTDFTRRSLQNEFLKLPRAQKEAVLTTLEEAVNTLKDNLKPKNKNA